MARKQPLAAQAKRVAAAGRNGDTALAHFSQDEIEILNWAQGGESINPDTGLPEFFSLGKVLKGVAKAAGALAGAAVGGPAGAAIGGGITSALLGDNMSKSLTTGLLAGLGAYGAQQTGLGDAMGMSTLSSGADLLGRQAAEGAVQTASGSGGGGMGMSALLPILGIGAAASAAGTPKQPKIEEPKPDTSTVPKYEALDRDQTTYAGDPYTYGIFGPEFVYFDDVNPDLQPIKAKRGGRIGFRFGGESAHDSSEGKGDPTGGNRGGGGGSNGGGNSGSGERGTPSQQQDRQNQANAERAGNVAPGVRGDGGQRQSGMSSAAADRMIIDRYRATPAERIKSDDDFWSGVRNLGERYNDYQNRGQGLTSDPLGTIGRVMGAVFGAGEINPLSQALGRSAEKTTADWGIDPIGAMLGGAGLMGQGFGLGTLYAAAKGVTGYPGPVVAFEEGAQPISTASSASGWSWKDDGIFAGFDNPATGTGGTGWQGSKEGGNDKDRPLPPIKPPVTTTKPPTTPSPADEDEDATGRLYHGLLSPYTYGQYGPEHLFFTGEIPFEEIDMARGGTVPGTRYGGGQDDIIPAALAPNEHVIDADVVAALGDGNSDAGHAKLEAFKAAIRKHKRSAPANTIPPKALGISQYMRRAA